MFNVNGTFRNVFIEKNGNMFTAYFTCCVYFCLLFYQSEHEEHILMNVDAKKQSIFRCSMNSVCIIVPQLQDTLLLILNSKAKSLCLVLRTIDLKIKINK